MSTSLITIGIAVAAFVAMVVLENLLPLRRTVEPKGRRLVRNLAVAAAAAVVAELLRVPLLVPVVAWTTARQVGLLYLVEMPATLRIVLAFLLLDYTLWWWHWLSHRVPVLWRFHLVHHADRDVDASTALRFHFGEHFLSLFFRIAQVVLIGTPPGALVIWQAVLFVSIFFHHSNLRLPVRVEAVLVRLIVTPRMHGIHHSDHRDETNSNWSSMLSAWDWLHGTMLLGVPQRDLVIGVPAYQDSKEVTITRLLSLPFRRHREYWQGRIGPRKPRGGLLAD